MVLKIGLEPTTYALRGRCSTYWAISANNYIIPLLSKNSNTKKEEYKDGVKLTVTSNYLVPSLEKGLVIHVGTKDDYGLCVIVSQVDNVETMYCNITNVAVKLYDYIDSGMLIGEANDKELILVFKENGQKISYEKYI